LENYDEDIAINLGVGEEISIADLSKLVQETVGFAGDIVWDRSKPDGTPRKLLDVSRMHALGWNSRISLVEGVSATYKWFVDNEKRNP
jgi:GDP-L-fucose synthase